ncbi:hypothetical protein FGO68_gene1469 [Halteria grandinella]|uniref:Uncharacterized protein n=1 Tax=Halteria grandinella TaxID=5974 RepID=A0A8J8NIV2_HALGN|nr:hypothetical protein FGO68_gene1469 [Halteria grandinella]
MGNFSRGQRFDMKTVDWMCNKVTSLPDDWSTFQQSCSYPKRGSFSQLPRKFTLLKHLGSSVKNPPPGAYETLYAKSIKEQTQNRYQMVREKSDLLNYSRNNSIEYSRTQKLQSLGKKVAKKPLCESPYSVAVTYQEMELKKADPLNFNLTQKNNIIIDNRRIQYPSLLKREPMIKDQVNFVAQVPR